MAYGQHIISVSYRDGFLEELDQAIIAKANSYRGVLFCRYLSEDYSRREISFYFPTRQKGEAFRKAAKRMIKRMNR